MVEPGVYESLAKPLLGAEFGALGFGFFGSSMAEMERSFEDFGATDAYYRPISARGFGSLAGKIFHIGLMGPMANRGCMQMFLGKFGETLRAA